MVRAGDTHMVGDSPARDRVAAGGGCRSGGTAGSDSAAGHLAVAPRREAGAVTVDGAEYAPGHVGVTWRVRCRARGWGTFVRTKRGRIDRHGYCDHHADLRSCTTAGPLQNRPRNKLVSAT